MAPTPEQDDPETYIISFVHEDVKKAGATFLTSSDEYAASMPIDGSGTPFGCPRAGNNETDRLLANALHLIGDLKTAIALAMSDHGDKLYNTVSVFDATEQHNMAQVYEVIEKEAVPNSEPTWWKKHYVDRG